MGRKLSIERIARGEGFCYLKHGAPVAADVVRRIERLAIPPAWSDVEIAASRSAKVLARGTDDAGRTQYIYHPGFRAEQDRAKFARLREFGAGLETFRERIAQDLRRHSLTRDRVLAGVLALIDQELFRVGSLRYADEHETYGVTTLEKHHLTLTASRAVLEFPGKSGSTFHRIISDRRLVRLISALAELPGEALFQSLDGAKRADCGEPRPVSAEAVNSLVKAHFGESHTAKSFRTWGATVQAVQVMATPTPELARDPDALVREAVRVVAKRLENTPAVAREAYVDPRIFEAFADPEHARALRRSYARMSPAAHMSVAERLTLRMLGDMQ